MGRTVPSYRMVLEEEITEWKRFSQFLRQADKVHFEELMLACRLYASYAGAACRPIPSDAMFMSMLLHHQKQLSELKSQIEQLKKERAACTATPENSKTRPQIAARRPVQNHHHA